MKILIMKFRVNDLDPSIGKQIEFSNKIVQDFFEFKKDKEYVDFIYNDYAFKPSYNKKVIHVYLSLSPARGDYKVYQNTDDSLFLKNFFIDDLGLSSEKNKNDYFTLTKLSNTQYALSYIPCESDLGKLIIGNQLKSGDIVDAIEDVAKTQKRTRINRLRNKLEEYAAANHLLISVDGSGDRIVIHNDCVIDVSKNILFTCIHNDRFDLFKNSVKKALEEKDYWHICAALEDFPSEPYAPSKILEILEGSDDKCLYAEITDDSKFETIIGELIKILSEQQNFLGQSPFTPTQIIYYGVPGSGKSHQIQEDLKKKGITEENHQQKRVVFHPDYCNADFVGQILPVTKRDGGIRYQFKAGPFTKILRDAYENPDKEYALIIEEINRGNAAAIFGDLFQLLDRKKENDPIETVNGNSYGQGWSDYCIENDYINAYFRGAYDSEEVPNLLPPKTLGNITFNDNVDIRLPPNLSFYATMNTSDQNVFTLDNAFQRRWEMKQISNDLAHDDPAADTTKQYDQIIGGTGVKWGEFREKINEIIMQSAEENGLSSMEDKRLGGWFITPKKEPNAAEGEASKITDEAFAEKVLKYLWDDAFKFDRPKHFGEIKTLEDLTKEFKKEGFKVFEEESISKLSQENGTTSAQTGTSET